MDDLKKFQYSKNDKNLLIWFVVCTTISRKKIRNFLFYLKKHESKKNDFWVNFKYLLNIYSNDNLSFDSIKNSFSEQLLYSIIENLFNDNIRVVSFWEKEYPKLLLETDDYPLLLFVKGNFNLLNSDCLSVVGTRRITSYGEAVLSRLIPEFVYNGFTVVSGCMYGVDLQAHQETINCQGNTIAVLGYGFNVAVQSQILKLQMDIIKNNGCLVTEYPPKTPASKWTFPERNRIVAAISKGVVVIEAALRSGTHITVGCALEAGREVFAVPGSIFSRYSDGTKYLLNQGAILVSSASDVIEVFKNYTKILSSNDIIFGSNPDSKEQQVIFEIQSLPQSASDLSRKLRIEIQELLSILSMLELENIVKNEAGVWHCVLSYSGYMKYKK